MIKDDLNRKKIVVTEQLPHNFLAEKMVLSCLLVSSDAIEMTIQILPVDAFYFQNHQELYRAIRSMYEDKLVVDYLTLTTYLQENGLLTKIGGIKVLIELINQISNLSNLQDYLSLVKDKFIRRSIIKLSYEAINSSYITNIPLESILSDLENRLFNITNEAKIQTLFTSAELLSQIFTELKQKSVNPILSGIPSGFYDLDALIQGFQRSDLIIIAGRPSMGKTALSLNIGLNVIKRSKLPVLIFNLEMSKEQIMYRLLAMEANVNQIRLKTGKLDKNDWLKLHKVMKIFSKIPLFIDDTFNLSIQDIRSRIKTIIFEQSKIGLVVIDYLQLMQNSNLKTDNRVQELSQITRLLKIIAREFNVPIIALSQLSRSVETRLDKRPILSDLRESGSIEQDADLVIMLHKNQTPKQLEQKKLQLIELIIAKHRNGPIGTIQLKFNGIHTKFSDLECPEPDSNW